MLKVKVKLLNRVRLFHSIMSAISFSRESSQPRDGTLVSCIAGRRFVLWATRTTAHLHSSHMLAKQCSKFSKTGFNSTWTLNFQMFKLDLEKSEEPEIKLPTSIESSKKQENSRKTSILYWLCPSLWQCGSQQTGKFFKRWEYQTTWPASWEICMQFRKQQLELDMEQQTGSKLGKEYIKAVYCQPAYLT